MLPINHVLLTFDLDGVLMVNPFGRGVFPEVQRRLASHVMHDGWNREQVHAHIQSLIVKRAAMLTRSGEWRAAYDWDEIVNTVAQELGSSERFDIAAMVRSYCRPGYIEKYDDVLESLTWLKQQQIRLAWVSNGYTIYQQPVLDALGIAAFFSGHTAPDLVGKAKPEPEIFWQARAENTTTCIHVGDTLAHDVAGAKNAGFVSVWIDRDLPDTLRNIPLLERGDAPDLEAHLRKRVAREFCWEAYGLNIPADIRPDYIIYGLDELRGVLADFDPLGKAVG